jgi:hypothetical protein
MKMKVSKQVKATERLKDLRALRQTLIQRRNDLETKITKVEQDIHGLTLAEKTGVAGV